VAQQVTPSEDPLAAAEAIRAKNGFRILLVAFATLLASFLVLLYFFWHLRQQPYALTASDVVAIFGAITSVVGTLVGAYFGVSAANGAKDSAASQAQGSVALAQRALDQAQ
jgi:hypothetical protein